MTDPLLFVGSTPLDEIQASGYSIQEDAPSIAGTIVTASGLDKRTYRKLGRTTIVAVLDNMDSASLASYLSVLNAASATFTFWSLRDQCYKIGDFYIDLEPVTVITAQSDPITDGYTLTLTQKGVITNV